ncbi:MAG: hypothetical protein AAB375_02040 [Patescibacteria group bacterium]
MEFLSKHIPLGILLTISSLGVILGDTFAKSWSLNQRALFLLLAFAGYFISSLFYIPTLLKEGLIITSVIWGVVSTMGFVAVGVLIFHEKISGIELVAVVLGICSLFVFAISHK